MGVNTVGFVATDNKDFFEVMTLVEKSAVRPSD
jgi:hypothetical protein